MNRQLISLLVDPDKTIENFAYVSNVTGESRGRMVDRLVEKEARRLKKQAGASKSEEA